MADSTQYARYTGFVASGSGGGGSGVTSLNGETGAVTLVAGTGISVTPSGSNITIASTGSSGANTALSNLASTAVNASINPSLAQTGNLSLGTTSLYWSQMSSDIVNVMGGQIRLYDGSLSECAIITPSDGNNIPDGTSGYLTIRNLITGITNPNELSTAFVTANDSANNANPTGSLLFETGNKTAGTGNSGGFTFRSGTSAGGTAGLFLVDNTAQVLGHSAFGATSSIDEMGPAVITVAETFTVPSAITGFLRAGISSNITINPTGTDNGSYYGINFAALTDPTSTHDMEFIAGSYGLAYHQGTGTIDYLIGYNADTEITSTGTVNNLIGFYADETAIPAGGAALLVAQFYNEPFNNAGTVTTNYGAFIQAPNNTGTMTNNYGVYITDHSTAGSSNSYNVYSAGATTKNKFEGSVSIGGGRSDSGFQYTASTGNVNINNNVEDVIIDAGTQAAITVTMPSAPVNGQLVTIAFVGSIATLTLNANSGQTITGNPATAAANSFASFIYRTANTKWYRRG